MPATWVWDRPDPATYVGSGKAKELRDAVLASGADTVITQGATQSNHARQTAAAAAKLGFACHILLEDRTGYTDAAYTQSANVLMDKLRRRGSDEHHLGRNLSDEGRSATPLPAS